jgi:hypothetical protein
VGQGSKQVHRFLAATEVVNEDGGVEKVLSHAGAS